MKKYKQRGLTNASRDYLATELDRLRQRHDRLEVEVKNDCGIIGDHRDAAETLQQADELVVLSDRINGLDRQLQADL